MAHHSPPTDQTPVLRTAGVDGFVISFGTALAEPANRAALAFCAALDQADLAGVKETSSTLVSTYLRFDPVQMDHATLRSALEALLSRQNWYDAALPQGRSLWRVPTVFGTNLAPQLAQAAALAGLSETEAVAELSAAQLRVQTIGFAPGQPYLGTLPPAWDVPRQSQLTEKVPVGALAVAIRQMVLFSVSAPTGWMHVGQTAIRLFEPEDDQPFLLRPGDELQFVPTTPEALDQMRGDRMGGATRVALP